MFTLMNIDYSTWRLNSTRLLQLWLIAMKSWMIPRIPMHLWRLYHHNQQEHNKPTKVDNQHNNNINQQGMNINQIMLQQCLHNNWIHFKLLNQAISQLHRNYYTSSLLGTNQYQPSTWIHWSLKSYHYNLKSPFQISIGVLHCQMVIYIYQGETTMIIVRMQWSRSWVWDRVDN